MGEGDTERSEALRRFEEAENDYWLRGNVVSERLPEVAVAGLIAGLDSQSLRVLAGQPAHEHRDNMDRWVAVLVELGRAPPEGEPLYRRAAYLMDGIASGRIDPCSEADAAYWVGSNWWEQIGRAPLVDMPEVVQELVAFVQLADECERFDLVFNSVPDEVERRVRVEEEIRERARRLRDRLLAEDDEERPTRT